MNEQTPERPQRDRRVAGPYSLSRMINDAYERESILLSRKSLSMYIDHLSATARTLWVDAEAYSGVVASLLRQSVEVLDRGGILVYLQTLFAPGSDSGELTLLIEGVDASTVEADGLPSPRPKEAGDSSLRRPMDTVEWSRLEAAVRALGGDVRGCGHATRSVCLEASLPVVRYGLEELPRPLLHGAIRKKRFKVYARNPFQGAVISEQLEKFGLVELEDGAIPDLIVWGGSFRVGGDLEAQAMHQMRSMEPPACLVWGSDQSERHPLVEDVVGSCLINPLFKFQLLGAVNALLNPEGRD